MAAVLSIAHDHLHADDEPFSQTIDFFTLHEEGWVPEASAGTDWPLAYGERFAHAAAAFTGFEATCQSPRGRLVWLASGIAGPGVTRVRVWWGRDHVDVEAEPMTGAFLAEVRPGASLRAEPIPG